MDENQSTSQQNPAAEVDAQTEFDTKLAEAVATVTTVGGVSEFTWRGERYAVLAVPGGHVLECRGA